MQRIFVPFLFATCLLNSVTAYSQTRYVEGEIVENFTLIDRATGDPVSLHDFEGKIVFLEWFAYWCPYCQAAAEQIEEEIVSYYATRDGNENGIPLMHVGINLQGDAETQTQAFVDKHAMALVLNDFDQAVANRFQQSGQPIFAIINGVANSPSHDQWELLFTRLGYGSFDAPIDTFRQVIDSVAAAEETNDPPTITTNPTNATVPTGSKAVLYVEASGQSLSYQWYKGDDAIEGATSSTLELGDISAEDTGNYTVTVSNPGGEVESESATITVVLSIDDYLRSAGLEGADLAWDADPDLDRIPNVFEFLAQTDPNDRLSHPSLTTRPVEIDGEMQLEVGFGLSSSALGLTVRVEFCESPTFHSTVYRVAREEADNSLFRFPFPGEVSALFARVVVGAE